MAAHRKRSIATPIWGGVLKVGATALNLALVITAIGFAFLALGPRLGDYRTLTMLSGSMSPKMPTGSVVIEVPKKATDLKVGDVVTIAAPTPDKPVVTHRVIEVTNEAGVVTIRTKGDNNPKADEWNSTIVGDKVWVATAAIPYVGKVTTALRSHNAHLVTAVILPLLLLAYALKSIWAPSAPKPAKAAKASKKGARATEAVTA